ncbi:MAG: hypothetical protein D6692_14610, partial [Planctomycetota bacterium]
MNQPTPHNPPPDTPQDAPPIDTPTGHSVRTDRPCARCGFNLFGQQIVREPHYNLIAARCPECGQLAALQEYPSLGKWADRWAKVLAALWVLAIIGAMAAQFGSTVGVLVASMMNVFEKAGTEIALRYANWEQQQSGVQGPAQPNMYYGGYQLITEEWWATERAAYLADQNRTQPLNRDTFAVWFVLTTISFAFGAFWSTVCLGVRRALAIIPALFPVGIALAFAWTISLSDPVGPGLIFATNAAADLHRTTMIIGGLSAIALGLLPGIFLGRKLARLLVRLALPPRMRTALSLL